MKKLLIGLIALSSISAFADCQAPYYTRVNTKILNATCFPNTGDSEIEFTTDFGQSAVLSATSKACRDAGFASMTGKKVSLTIQCVKNEEIITNVTR